MGRQLPQVSVGGGVGWGAGPRGCLAPPPRRPAHQSRRPRPHLELSRPLAPRRCHEGFVEAVGPAPAAVSHAGGRHGGAYQTSFSLPGGGGTVQVRGRGLHNSMHRGGCREKRACCLCLGLPQPQRALLVPSPGRQAWPRYTLRPRPPRAPPQVFVSGGGGLGGMGGMGGPFPAPADPFELLRLLLGGAPMGPDPFFGG